MNTHLEAEAEDFLKRFIALIQPETTYPIYFGLRDVAVNYDIIKHFHGRFVSEGEWGERRFARALCEVFRSGQNLTRAQLAQADGRIGVRA